MTLDYGSYGISIFLMKGNAGFLSQAVVSAILPTRGSFTESFSHRDPDDWQSVWGMLYYLYREYQGILFRNYSD